MPSLVLIGDSILDNRSYTAPHPATEDLLREQLGAGWEVTLAARDGARMEHIPAQLDAMPSLADVTVVSVGGNDLLCYLDLLTPHPTTSHLYLEALANLAHGFAAEYRDVLRAARARARRLVICTIYEVPLTVPAPARLVHVVLSLINDRIIREGARIHADILDLRGVCTDPADFVLEIEPSAQGAAKIAAAIAGVAVAEEAARGARLLGG